MSERQRFDPPLERTPARWAAALFLVVLAATSAFLWHAHSLDPIAKGLGGTGIVGLLVAVAALTQPRAGTAQKVEARPANAREARPCAARRESEPAVRDRADGSRAETGRSGPRSRSAKA